MVVSSYFKRQDKPLTRLERFRLRLRVKIRAIKDDVIHYLFYKRVVIFWNPLWVSKAMANRLDLRSLRVDAICIFVEQEAAYAIYDIDHLTRGQHRELKALAEKAIEQSASQRYFIGSPSNTSDAPVERLG